MSEPLTPRAHFDRLQSGGRCENVTGGSDQVEAGKSLVRRYFEMWNTGEGAIADQVLGRRYVDHAYPDVIGPAAVRSFAPRFHKANPDARMTPEILGADGEYVAVRNTIRKTHDGKPVEFQGTALFRIGGGRIVEQWSWYPGKDKARLHRGGATISSA
jgi:predicted SnoaL-like aldol condensation-catalyzing enzyme